MKDEIVKLVERPRIEPSKGSAGLHSQLPGMATTISNVANASGGISGGNMIKTSIK